MDFEKNWDKLVKAILFLVGAIFFIIALTDLPKLCVTGKDLDMKESVSIGLLALYLSGAIYFLAMTFINVMKLIGQGDASYMKWIKFIVGCIGTLAVILFLFMPFAGGGELLGVKLPVKTGLNMLKDANAMDTANYITMFLVFGLLPLVKGIKCAFCGKAAADK